MEYSVLFHAVCGVFWCGIQCTFGSAYCAFFGVEYSVYLFRHTVNFYYATGCIFGVVYSLILCVIECNFLCGINCTAWCEIQFTALCDIECISLGEIQCIVLCGILCTSWCGINFTV